MIDYKKDDFDGTLDDIMESIEEILNKTGEGYEIEKQEDSKKKEDK